MEFLKISDNEKKVLFDFLGFKVDEKGIILSKKTNKPIECPYTEELVRFDKASVMPGSTIVFNTTPLTLAEYFSDHVESGEIECQKKTKNNGYSKRGSKRFW